MTISKKMSAAPIPPTTDQATFAQNIGHNLSAPEGPFKGGML